MLTIYGGPTFNATKIVFTAEQLGIEYNYVHVDLRKGEQKTPEHFLRHPLGKIPAIEYEGKSLFESNSICRFLAASTTSSLYSGDTYQLAIIDQWVDMMSHHTGRWIGAYYFQEFITPRFFKKEPNQEALSEAKGYLDEQLPVIEKQLSSNTYFAGEILTIADTIAFSFFYTHENSSVDFNEFENISRWYTSIRNSDAFIRTKTCLDKAHGEL